MKKDIISKLSLEPLGGNSVVLISDTCNTTGHVVQITDLLLGSDSEVAGGA